MFVVQTLRTKIRNNLFTIVAAPVRCRVPLRSASFPKGLQPGGGSGAYNIFHMQTEKLSKKERKALKKQKRENKAFELAIVEEARMITTAAFLRDVYHHHGDHDATSIDRMIMVTDLLGRTESFMY